MKTKSDNKCAKIGFKDKVTAEEFMWKRRIDYRNSKFTVKRTYECDKCRKWHLTSRSENKQYEKR